VFYNLFFKAEPFATILAAYGPHAMIRVSVLLHEPNWQGNDLIDL